MLAIRNIVWNRNDISMCIEELTTESGVDFDYTQDICIDESYDWESYKLEELYEDLKKEKDIYEIHERKRVKY